MPIIYKGQLRFAVAHDIIRISTRSSIFYQKLVNELGELEKKWYDDSDYDFTGIHFVEINYASTRYLVFNNNLPIVAVKEFI